MNSKMPLTETFQTAVT